MKKYWPLYGVQGRGAPLGHVARILLRRVPRNILTYVSYFKPDYFHASPIDIMFVNTFLSSANWIAQGGAMAPVALPSATSLGPQ